LRQAEARKLTATRPERWQMPGPLQAGDVHKEHKPNQLADCTPLPIDGTYLPVMQETQQTVPNKNDLIDRHV
jgi:hypothetical protein